MTTLHKMRSVVQRVERWVQLIARNIWAYLVPANLWAFAAEDACALQARTTLVLEGFFILCGVVGFANLCCLVYYIVTGTPTEFGEAVSVER